MSDTDRDQGPGHYRLTLRALPGWGPPDQQLRRALKSLLRAHGLRCVRVEDLPADGAPAPTAGEETAGPGVLPSPR